MLDEIREFEEYNCKLFEKTNVRLLPSLFKEHGGAGIRRPQLIIARYYLFTEFDYNNTTNPAEKSIIRDKVKKILNAWCFDEDIDFELRCPISKGWLKNYMSIYECFPNQTKKQALTEEYIQFLWESYKKSKKHWITDNIYSPITKDASLKYMSNFDIVVADAIHQGPLKKRYLVCNESFATNSGIHQIQYTNEYYTSQTPLKGATLKKYKPTTLNSTYNHILKQLVYYLIEKKTNQYSYINKTDLANWMNYTSYAKDTRETIFYYNNNPIFQFEGSKLFVLPEFIEDFAFQLIDEDELKHSVRYSIYFEDLGFGKNSLLLNRIKHV